MSTFLHVYTGILFAVFTVCAVEGRFCWYGDGGAAVGPASRLSLAYAHVNTQCPGAFDLEANGDQVSAQDFFGLNYVVADTRGSPHQNMPAALPPPWVGPPPATPWQFPVDLLDTVNNKRIGLGVALITLADLNAVIEARLLTPLRNLLDAYTGNTGAEKYRIRIIDAFVQTVITLSAQAPTQPTRSAGWIHPDTVVAVEYPTTMGAAASFSWWDQCATLAPPVTASAHLQWLRRTYPFTGFVDFRLTAPDAAGNMRVVGMIEAKEGGQLNHGFYYQLYAELLSEVGFRLQLGAPTQTKYGVVSNGEIWGFVMCSGRPTAWPGAPGIPGPGAAWINYPMELECYTLNLVDAFFGGGHLAVPGAASAAAGLIIHATELDITVDLAALPAPGGVASAPMQNVLKLLVHLLL